MNIHTLKTMNSIMAVLFAPWYKHQVLVERVKYFLYCLVLFRLLFCLGKASLKKTYKSKKMNTYLLRGVLSAFS